MAKYSGAKEALIEIKIENQALIIKVADNGRGFEPGSGDKRQWKIERIRGNGLRNISRRAANLSGDLEIESKMDAGTTITLNVQINKN